MIPRLNSKSQATNDVQSKSMGILFRALTIGFLAEVKVVLDMFTVEICKKRSIH